LTRQQKLLINLNPYLPEEFKAPEWINFNHEQIQAIIQNKAKNPLISKFKGAIAFYKKVCLPKYAEFGVLVPSLDYQPRKIVMDAMLFLARSPQKYLVDTAGQKQKVSIFTLFKDLFLCGLGLVIAPIFLLKIWLEIIWLNKLPVKGCLKVNSSSVAYLRTDLWFGVKAGGSIGHIAGVIDGLQKKKFKVHLLSSDCLGKINYQKTAFTKILPPQILSHLSSAASHFFYNSRFFKVSKKIFKTHKFGFIYQRYSFGNFSGLKLKRKFKIPFILEYNGSEIWVSKNWGLPLKFEKLIAYIKKTNFKFADLIVVVSDPLKEELVKAGVPSSKILVNPNGVDPQEFKPQINGLKIRKKYKLKNKIIVGFIGTFGPWHGVDILVKSIKAVVKKNPNIHFLLIGDGSLKSKIEEIIKENGISKYVTLTGLIPQSEAPEYLAACDILASPTVPNQDGSRFFGSPTKLFEYMAMGKAIVASDLEQLGEILENKKNALLVKPGDINDLEKIILQLATNPKLIKELGENARQEVVKNYTWEEHVRKILSKVELN